MARVVWICIIKSINMTGKNGQQVMQGIMQKVKAHHKLLASVTTNAKMELALLVTVQVGGWVLGSVLKGSGAGGVLGG